MTVVFEIKTVKSGIFKTLVEGLKNVLNEANLIVNAEGLKICQYNSKRTEIVYLFLDASQFEYYRLEKPAVIGLDLLKLHKILKNAQPDDTVSLMYNDATDDEMVIKLENSFKHLVKRSTLKLLCLEKIGYKIPTIHYDHEITIGSLDLQRMCKEFHVLGCKKVSLTSIDNQLTFSSDDGTLSNFEYVWQQEEGTQQQTISFQKTSNLPSQGTFALDALQFSTKTTNINQFAKLYLKNDNPLTVEYQTALGSLRFLILPLVE